MRKFATKKRNSILGVLVGRLVYTVIWPTWCFAWCIWCFSWRTWCFDWRTWCFGWRISLLKFEISYLVFSSQKIRASVYIFFQINFAQSSSFCVLCGKKSASLKKVHHRRLWRLWQISAILQIWTLSHLIMWVTCRSYFYSDGKSFPPFFSRLWRPNFAARRSVAFASILHLRWHSWYYLTGWH